MKNQTLFLLLLLVLAACAPNTEPTPVPATATSTALSAGVSPTIPPTVESTATASLTQTPATATPAAQPPAPQTISAANFATLPSVPSSPLVLMDHVGGAAQAVALAGDVAFAGEGVRVTAVSLTNPANPLVLGRSAPLGGVVQRLALYLDAAYVVAEPGWIDVLDVSDPAQIRRIAQLPLAGEVQDIAVVGDYLYATAVHNNETTLTAWDIRGMATAVPAASLTLPTSTPTRLATDGERLFVSASERIEMFDITEPGRPISVGEISELDGFSVNPALPLADGRLLFANEFYQQFNISNPAAVAQVASAPLGDILTGDDFPRRGGFLSLQGETAVLIDTGYYDAPAGPSRLWAIDTVTAEPTAQLVADLPFTANDVSYRGTMAVVAHKRGLSVIDLANATAPSLLSELNWGAAVALSGDLAGFATGSNAPSSALQFDLSDLKSRSTFLSLQTFNDGSTVMGDAQFVLDPEAGYPGAGLVQLDVSDPLAPVETAVIDPKINEIQSSGAWLFGSGNGLQTFALNDAGMLESIAICDDCYDGGIHKIVWAGLDTLHLLGQDGIYMVAVAGPTELIPLGLISSDFPVLDGAVGELDNAAYYLGTPCRFGQGDCEGSTLWTFNTLFAYEPEVKNVLSLPGNARRLEMFGGLLWVMLEDGRFIPHDLTNPFAPQMLNKGIQLPLSTTLVQTEVISDRLFVSHPDAGILVYQMGE